MSRQHKKVERIHVIDGECVKCQCDVCGAIAKNPKHSDVQAAFQEKNSLNFGGAVIETHWSSGYTDDYFDEKYDLCFECAELLKKTMGHKLEQFLYGKD